LAAGTATLLFVDYAAEQVSAPNMLEINGVR
jgi:hypothetical protein